jgi:hypothetical protein
MKTLKKSSAQSSPIVLKKCPSLRDSRASWSNSSNLSESDDDVDDEELGDAAEEN